MVGNGARLEPETLTIALDDAPPLPTETLTDGAIPDGDGGRGSDVDALIERARRRRARREGLARRNAAAGDGNGNRDGGRGTGLRGTGRAVTGRAPSGGGGDGNASAANLAKRMLASAMREHNESVMRELGDEYTERRDKASGLAG